MDPETARKIEFVAVEDIRPYENNPRNNSGAVAKVAESIREFGFGNPLLLDRERVIIAGHTRFEAAKRLGMERVPCIVLAHLTEAQANALRLADNKTQELSTWDYDKLTAEIAKLDGSGIDVRLFGFDVGGEQSATEALSDVGGKSIYYEPKEQPALKLAQCFDTTVYDAKIAALKELREGGGISDCNFNVLCELAHRFVRIDFEAVANYYAFNATDAEREALERLRCVLVDGGVEGFVEDDLLRILRAGKPEQAPAGVAS